jgi:hypothetical protein
MKQHFNKKQEENSQEGRIGAQQFCARSKTYNVSQVEKLKTQNKIFTAED